MGMFIAISSGYISEVLGPRTRGFAMTTLGASPLLGIIAGVAIGSESSIIGNVTSQWGSWKLILARELRDLCPVTFLIPVQWVLPVIAIPLVLWAPESPTQLVKRGKPEAALASLRRLRKKDTHEQNMVRLASIQLAVASSIEEAKSQSESYLECFRGVDRKRTFTVIGVSRCHFCWVSANCIQLLVGSQFSGVSLLSNGLYFL